jgi:hypothetical protein
MSDQTKSALTRLGLAVGIVSGLSGLFGAFVLLPYRIDAAEQEIKQLKTEARVDHELLVRIDERSKRIEERLEDLRR